MRQSRQKWEQFWLNMGNDSLFVKVYHMRHINQYYLLIWLDFCIFYNVVLNHIALYDTLN